jgi:hypothetical protein
MASMGDVPDVARNKMSLCSCHKLQKNALFALKKSQYNPIFEGRFNSFPGNIRYFPWPDPGGYDPGGPEAYTMPRVILSVFWAAIKALAAP